MTAPWTTADEFGCPDSTNPDSTSPEPTSLDDDRILALELVRATEAAAMAAARFLGRGDEDEVDGAAVDAMRPVLGTIPMRGVIVIGEGEKDDAPMLYAGRARRIRPRAAGRHRHRPGRRGRADGEEPAERDVGDRAGRSGNDVRPGPVRLHGQVRRRTGPGRRGRLRRTDRGHPRPPSPGPAGSTSRTSPSPCWTGPGTRSWSSGSGPSVPGSSS